jgi:exopolysaccharide biosynthesis protein
MPKNNIAQKYFLVTFLIFICVIQSAIADVASDTQIIQNAHWETHKIARGIILKQAIFPKLFGESQSISIVEVDLDRKKIQISIAADPQKRILTSTFAKEKNAAAAINGTFFDMKNGGSVMLVKQDGKVINPSKIHSERSDGALTIDGHEVKIVPSDSTEADWAEHLKAPNVMVSGPILLMDGKPVTLSKAGFNVLTHPRSAVAITNDNKLLLVAVDGRSETGSGMSLFSLTTLLQTLDARDAMNLDGGGSTTLYAKGQTENGVVNHPSDNKKFDHEGERTVANAILVNVN